MDVWQQARQIQFRLRGRKWLDAPANDPIFGTVLVSPGQQEELTDRVGFPFLWINDAGAEFDPQDREQLRLFDQSWELMIFHSNMGDGGSGQGLLLGANRTGGKTSSKGRGLMEVNRELLDTLASLGPADGMSLRMMAKSKVRPLRIKKHGYLIQQAFAFNTRASNQLTYPAPTRFTAVGGVGSIALTWIEAPDRYDLVPAAAYIVRVDSGGTPPTTPTGGTGGTTFAKGVSAGAFATAPATYGVSIFAAYDDFGDPPEVADKFSVAVSVSGVVVT